MTYLIVGGGVAGLTVARSLHLQGRRFRLFDATLPRSRPDRGLGLWGRAQVALAELGLAPLLRDSERAHYIPAAAYRSRDGAWLSRCSSAPHNTRRVCTVREADLLAALRNGLPHDCLHYGRALTAAQSDTASARLFFSDGSEVEGTAVIVADGAGSPARRDLFPGVLAYDSGLTAFSGLLERHELPDDVSEPLGFETLSAGARFAMVPLSRGGYLWFATMRSSPLGLPFPDATLGSGSAAIDVPSAAIDALHAAYAGWHAPIENVLTASASSASLDGIAAGGAADCRDGEGRPMQMQRVLVSSANAPWWRERAVLVGDAAHALPINLAQGDPGLDGP